MSSQKKKLQLLQEAKEKPRGCHVNSVTITAQKIGNKLPLEAKKSPAVSAAGL